jgi:hypothetical protein
MIGIALELFAGDFVGRGFVVQGKLGNGRKITPNGPFTVIANA